MTPLATLQAPPVSRADAIDALSAAEELLRRRGRDVRQSSLIGNRASVDLQDYRAAVATALMDEFRRSRSRTVFEALVQLTSPSMLQRVRSRLRASRAQLDPQEVLQDVFVNVYRYPDRFEGKRPGAFAAWSSTIVNNAVRRQLRGSRSGLALQYRSSEMLGQEVDPTRARPDQQAQDREDVLRTVGAYQLLLSVYMAAFEQLSDRERFVLQMVEIKQMRYADLAQILEMRAEALKMVVFRARRRVLERMRQWLPEGESAESGQK